VALTAQTILERTRLFRDLPAATIQQMSAASGLAEESALLSVPEHLARRFLNLGRLHGHETLNGVELSISQKEVARFLGLSRQAVNQYL
jgi:CRP-like cAMP-binding protein